MNHLKNTVMTCGLLAASATIRLFGQTEPAPAATVAPSSALPPATLGGQGNYETGVGLAGVGFATFPRRPVHAENPLVVRFHDAEPKDAAKLEDDLAVMAHLLRKTIAEKFGTAQDRENVLGVDISFAPGSQPIRTMYLDGFGALFLLDVGFPVHPFPKPQSAPKDKPATDSTWEEAKREYYGAPAPRAGGVPAGAPYDERKVEMLKEALAEALRSAANIRGMNPDNFVSICVAGGSSFRALTGRGTTATGVPFQIIEPDKSYEQVGEVVATEKSFLTMRAKKADIDAVAAGKMTPEQFGKAITTDSYLRPLGQGVGGGSYSVREWMAPDGFQQK